MCPAGLHGDLAQPFGEECVEADITVTFFRKKPAHVLMPGRDFCGDVTVADIGIPDAALEAIRPRPVRERPAAVGCGLSLARCRWGTNMLRGHAVVVSGPAHATGAARLAAMSALRVGAGLVSVASPPDAVAVNASALTAMMVKPFDGANGLGGSFCPTSASMRSRSGRAAAWAPTRAIWWRPCSSSGAAAVLDADALTSFADDPECAVRAIA